MSDSRLLVAGVLGALLVGRAAVGSRGVVRAGRAGTEQGHVKVALEVYLDSESVAEIVGHALDELLERLPSVVSYEAGVGRAMLRTEVVVRSREELPAFEAAVEDWEAGAIGTDGFEVFL